MNIEACVRKIEDREYVFIEHRDVIAVVQDFIRFPHVVPFETEDDVRTSLVPHLKKNSLRGAAMAVTHGQFEEVWVTGEPLYPVLVADHQTAIGVDRASMSDIVSHSIATDTSGVTLAQVARGPKSLPIGLFEVASDSRVVDLWASRGQVGMYRRHVRDHHAIKRLSSGISTELYASDPAATAVQYAVTYLKANIIRLVSCDPSFAEQRDGSVPFGGRYIYPSDIYRLLTLHAVCLVASRNHIDVGWVEGTMVPVPGAASVDRRLNEGTP